MPGTDDNNWTYQWTPSFGNNLSWDALIGTYSAVSNLKDSLVRENFTSYTQFSLSPPVLYMSMVDEGGNITELSYGAPSAPNGSIQAPPNCCPFPNCTPNTPYSAARNVNALPFWWVNGTTGYIGYQYDGNGPIPTINYPVVITYQFRVTSFIFGDTHIKYLPSDGTVYAGNYWNTPITVKLPEI